VPHLFLQQKDTLVERVCPEVYINTVFIGKNFILGHVSSYTPIVSLECKEVPVDERA